MSSLSPDVCPGCQGPLHEELYDGHYDRAVLINVCHGCNGLWFDRFEARQLTAAATLVLFDSMRARALPHRALPAGALGCLRCGGPLALRHDRAGTHPFSDHACPDGCGRFITWFMFLREKQLVHEASSGELESLKARVKQVSCSQCGGRVDLDGAPTCPHCQAPVTLLGSAELDATLAQLELPDADAQQQAHAADAQAVRRALASTRLGPARSATGAPPDLLDLGIGALLGLLKP